MTVHLELLKANKTFIFLIKLLVIRYRYITLKMLSECLKSRLPADEEKTQHDLLGEYRDIVSKLKQQPFTNKWVSDVKK